MKFTTAMAAAGQRAVEVLPNLAWQNFSGNVLGIYLHGMLENPRGIQALFGQHVPTLESVFEGLADFVAQHMRVDTLRRFLTSPAWPRPNG